MGRSPLFYYRGTNVLNLLWWTGYFTNGPRLSTVTPAWWDCPFRGSNNWGRVKLIGVLAFGSTYLGFILHRASCQSGFGTLFFGVAFSFSVKSTSRRGLAIEGGECYTLRVVGCTTIVRIDVFGGGGETTAVDSVGHVRWLPHRLVSHPNTIATTLFDHIVINGSPYNLALPKGGRTWDGRATVFVFLRLLHRPNFSASDLARRVT